MPRILVTRAVARADGAFDVGEHDVSPDVAQDAQVGGWGELLREVPPETPEGSRRRRGPAPETRSR